MNLMVEDSAAERAAENSAAEDPNSIISCI
jgi:hypothetical protein